MKPFLSNDLKSVSSILGAGPFLATVALSMVVAPLACFGQGTANVSALDVTVPEPMSSSSRVAAEGKALHVTVGHSIFIDTKTRLRRVYVTDPTIVNSVTLTPTEIVVTAMQAGTCSLTLLDEANRAQSYVISSDIEIGPLKTAIAEAMRSDSVKVEGSGTKVTLSGSVPTDALSDTAVKLAGLYSKEVVNAIIIKPVHPKQVRLEVRILEVDRTKLLQQGINLFNPGGNTNWLASTTTAQYPSTMAATVGSAVGAVTTTNPLNFMLYSAKLNLGTTIEDLQTKQILQILAEPTITTVSGKKAEFHSGGEFPFPLVQPGSGTNSTPVVTIQFRPYGVQVDFTPVVNEDGTITLKVTPEVSALDYSNSVSISGFTVPALSTRKAETEVELRSNQSFAISGLLDQRTTDIMNKTPGIANVPILGAFFKSKNVNHSTSELIVVVTPTVVDPLTETTQPVEPSLPIPVLDTGSFDKSLGKDASPQPVTPPLDSDKPPYSNQPTAPAPAPTTPPAAAAPRVTPQAPAKPAAASKTPATAPAAVPRNVTPAKAAPASAPAQKPAAIIAPVVATASVAPAPERTSLAKLTPTATAQGTANSQARTMVEVMTLSHESDADAMVAALKRHGYDVAVSQSPSDLLLHLDVGPFVTKNDAETMRQRLLQDGYNATLK
ncbi:MAG TPA: pilus assembly protein N-terminal domain-containing protein [Acidobacteriaceae bacterium]